MREIIQKVYRFDELSDKAKQFAINKYRNNGACDDDFYINSQIIVEDFISDVLEKYGFEIISKNISYSGFWSQGNGASFTHDFTLEELSKLLDLLDIKIKHGLKQFYLENLYSLRIKRIDSSYYHKYTVDTEIISNDLSDYNILDNYFCKLDKLITEKINQLKNSLCNELYKQLEESFEDINSDEYISDVLLNNDYEFYENGKMYF